MADTGTLTNTSVNYVNSYTGEAEAFDSHNTMSPQMKTYYNTQALENTRPKRIFAQFGDREPLPERHGTTVEWRKRNTFGDVGKLTEGVIPKGKKFGYSAITADIYEYGDYVTLTDWLQMHAIDPVVLDATEELTAAAMDTQDKLVRDELLTGTQVMFAPKSNNDAVTSRSGIDNTCILTSKMVAKVATQFAADSVPNIDGHAVAVGIIHPFVAEDLRLNDANWVDYHKYDQPEEIFNGEVGMLHGVRFVVSPNAKIFKGENLASDSATLTTSSSVSASKTIPFDGGTVVADALIGRKVLIGTTVTTVTDNTDSQLTVEDNVTCDDNTTIYPGEGGAAGTAVFACEFLGKDAYKLIDAAGGNLQVITKNKGEIGGPLEQFSTVGVKYTAGCKIVYPERVIRVECGSSYGSVAVGN